MTAPQASVGAARSFGFADAVRHARWLAWVPLLIICATSGILFNFMMGLTSPVIGAVYGTMIGGAVLGFERGLILPALQARIRRWPTLLYLLAAEAVYLAMIHVGSAVATLVTWPFRVRTGSIWQAMVPNLNVMTYSLLVTGLLAATLRVRDLIGTDVLINSLIGRYHRPVEEERIFLFIDVVGSTAYAQQHGDLRAQEFLCAVFAALAEPVRRHRGSIDDYVGDMALVTWPLATGTGQARCIACVFAFLDAVAENADDWRTRFGQVPRFRAALHGGPVVTAEIGVDRHKISYFGDVVNTTGRMETLCRSLDADFIISGDLLARVPQLPAGVHARSLGAHAVKGRGRQLTVLALETG